MGGFVGLVLFLAFVYGVFYLVRAKDQKPPAIRRPVPPAIVTMELDMLHGLLDELDALRLQAGRLRLGMKALIDHWPGHFRPEELAVAQGLVDEAGEVLS